jgi:hypothetical protein
MINKQNNSSDSLGKVNLNRYETDIEGVSIKTLERGLWWTKNRKKLKITLVILLILVSIFSWGYTLYGFGYYLLVGMNADNQTVKNIAQSSLPGQDYLNQRTYKNLVLTPARYIANNGKYDLYEVITNPNAKWWATFDYCFKGGDGEQACGKEFILPGEKKYITALAEAFNSAPSDLNFITDNLDWNKIDNHLIPDWNTYRNDHLNISLSNQLFTPAANNASTDKLSLNSLAFSLTNNSAYSYWEAPFTIILTNDSGIAYLTSYTASNFGSHSSRDVKLTWAGGMGAVTGISVIPDLNILNNNIYQQPQ